MKLLLPCSILCLLAFAYGVSGGGGGGEKERPAVLTSSDAEELERRLLSMQKRAGARAFGPTRPRDFESYFYPSSKRHETFSPYYFYQQPKRGGGRAFYSYWNPPNLPDGRFIEDSPFYRKRSLMREFDDYSY